LRLRRRGAWHGRGGELVVCNHLSWIDPLLLAAWRPAVFVTSVETGEDSLLGRICAAAGCVFMERRRRSGLVDECGRLAALLRHHAVVVFPEATSSAGDSLLPFRPAAFAAAIAARAAVQPLALRYVALDGRAVGPGNRDRVCWHGDMTFLPHLCRLLAIGRVEAEVTAAEAVQADGHPCRKALAQDLHRTIATALGLDGAVAGACRRQAA
jgi:1-acyl-sn-glycerol-3-phosphate acyltransferase